MGPSTRGAVRHPNAELLSHGQRTLGLLAVAGHLFGAQGREHIHLLVGERPQVPPSPPLGRGWKSATPSLEVDRLQALAAFSHLPRRAHQGGAATPSWSPHDSTRPASGYCSAAGRPFVSSAPRRSSPRRIRCGRRRGDGRVQFVGVVRVVNTAGVLTSPVLRRMLLE